MPSKIIPRPAGIEELKVSAGYLAARKLWGVAVAEEARAIAPVGNSSFVDGITSDADGSVGSTFFTAHLLEWGTTDTPVFATMRKAVERAGLRMEVDPKS